MDIVAEKTNHNNVYRGYLVIAIIMIVIAASLKGVFHANLITYSPEELHFFDNSLFTHNLDVMLNEHSISPRMASLFLFRILMWTGISYESSYLVIYALTCILTSIAIFIYAQKEFEFEHVIATILLTFLIVSSSVGISASFYTFQPNSLFLGLGTAFFTLALVSLLVQENEKNLYLPYLLVSLAALSHIHEGIWGFVIISLIAIYKYGIKIIWNYSPYIAIAVILCLTIPSILTSEVAANPELLYEKYVKIRVPHHLYFWQSFPIKTLESFIKLLLITYIAKLYGAGNKGIKFCYYAIGIFLCLNVVWYVTYELMHSSFFIKMYIPKCFKNINILFTLLLCKYVSKEKQSLPLIYLISCTLLPHYYWTIVLLVYIITIKFDFSERIKSTIWISLSTIPIIISLSIQINTAHLVVTFVVLILLIFKKYSLSIIPIAIGCYLMLFLWNVKKPCLNFTDSMIAYRVGEPLYNFAKSVSTIIPQESVILMDNKSNKSGYIQHITRRDAYILYKSAPSNEKGIEIWYNRNGEMNGFRSWSANQLEGFMKGKDLKYLIVEHGMYNSTFDSYFSKKIINDAFVLLELKK